MTTLSAICYDRAGENNHDEAEACRDAMLANDRFALAFGLVCEGFCVIPLLSDSKRPARQWKEYQYRLPTMQELVSWFIDHDFSPAIVTGEISGITVIDCDDADALDQCLDNGLESSLGQTTRRGRHMVFRHSGERNTVRVNGWEGVDRRGEGGYVAAYRDSGHWTREAVLMAPTATSALDDHTADAQLTRRGLLVCQPASSIRTT